MRMLVRCRRCASILQWCHMNCWSSCSLVVVMLPLSYTHRRLARTCMPTRTSWRALTPRRPPTHAWLDSADTSLARYAWGTCSTCCGTCVCHSPTFGRWIIRLSCSSVVVISANMYWWDTVWRLAMLPVPLCVCHCMFSVFVIACSLCVCHCMFSPYASL